MGLVILCLRSNKLSGTVPTELLQHPHIYDLELQGNQVGGLIENIIVDGPWKNTMENLNLKDNIIRGNMHSS
eukprot:4036902-Ditylum_brightwellii.AAC.1